MGRFEGSFLSTTSDANIESDLEAVYADAHNAAVGNSLSAMDANYIGQFYGANVYRIYRSFDYFDTSPIPSDATIISAILSLYKESMAGSAFDVVIQNGQPDYPHDPAVDADYLYSHYSGDGGSLNTSSFGAGYTNIPLNSSGRGWIYKGVGATTKLALISKNDIDEAAPTGTERLAIWTRNKGDAYAPKLYVSAVIGPFPTHFRV